MCLEGRAIWQSCCRGWWCYEMPEDCPGRLPGGVHTGVQGQGAGWGMWYCGCGGHADPGHVWALHVQPMVGNSLGSRPEPCSRQGWSTTLSC